MKIYTPKHASGSIPIVPMLDILTILLIFFIVQTEFKRQVNVLNLSLPDTESLMGNQGDKESVLLELSGDGQMAFNGKLLAMENLPMALAEFQKSHPEGSIQVYAATGASMGQFIEAMDQLSAAGIDAEQIPVRIQYKGE